MPGNGTSLFFQASSGVIIGKSELRLDFVVAEVTIMAPPISDSSPGTWKLGCKLDCWSGFLNVLGFSSLLAFPVCLHQRNGLSPCSFPSFSNRVRLLVSECVLAWVGCLGDVVVLCCPHPASVISRTYVPASEVGGMR